jgi:hypothetical protein
VTRHDDDRIRVAIEARLAFVEGIIPPPPAWRGVDEGNRESTRVAVVAGPAFRGGAQDGPALGLLLAVVAVLVAVLAYGLVAGLGVPRPSPGWVDRFPAQSASTFARPFTYAIDPASGIVQGDLSAELHQFGVRDPVDPARFNRIVAVRLVDVVRLEPCRSSATQMIPLAGPQAFVEYLGSISGLIVGPTADATVDGRPALEVEVTNRADASCPSVSIWPGESPFSGTAAARRIQVLEVDGAIVLVVAAVEEESDLAAWLPTAEQFIATLHFIASDPGWSSQP